MNRRYETSRQAPLHTATIIIIVISIIIINGHTQVNRRYETSGQAPLHIAASTGSINVIEALIAAGARLEVMNLLDHFQKSIVKKILTILFSIRRLTVFVKLPCTTASPPRAAPRQQRLSLGEKIRAVSYLACKKEKIHIRLNQSFLDYDLYLLHARSFGQN